MRVEDFRPNDGGKIPEVTKLKLTKAFELLSEAEKKRLRGIGQKWGGVRLLDMMVAAKRSFVGEIFAVVQPRTWLQSVEQNYGIQLQSRKPEEVPADLLDR